MSENLDAQTQEFASQNEDETTQNEGGENIDFSALSPESVRINELENSLADLTDKYYRANADFENIKKRFEKEKSDIASYANEKFARDLLPVIDALEMALGLEATDEKLKEGIELTMSEFKKCLQKHGVSEICTKDGFDPNFHNAVLQVDGEVSGQIVQVMQKGYLINGRVLRPAMVSIAK